MASTALMMNVPASKRTPGTPMMGMAAGATGERRWETLANARVLDGEYMRVVMLPAIRVCYQVDPLVADMLRHAKPDFDFRKDLWRVVLAEVPSGEMLSVKKDSQDYKDLEGLGCEMRDNMLVTAAGALAAVNAVVRTGGANAEATAAVKAAIAALAEVDRKITESFVSSQRTSAPAIMPPPPAPPVAPVVSAAAAAASPAASSATAAAAAAAAQALAGPRTKRDHMNRLIQMMNEMRSQTLELKLLLQCTQQDLAMLKQTGYTPQHPVPFVPPSPGMLQQPPTAAATATINMMATSLAHCAPTSDDDECVLRSAQNGFTTILKFLSPKQTVLFILFLEDTLRQYGRT